MVDITAVTVSIGRADGVVTHWSPSPGEGLKTLRLVICDENREAGAARILEDANYLTDTYGCILDGLYDTVNEMIR